MSRATSAIGRDVSITIFTASSLNSCVNFLRRSGILHPPFRAGLYWIRCPESPRHARDSAVLVPSRRAEDLYAGWWQLINGLGAVPRVLVWDGEGAVGRWRGRSVELTAECQGFRGTLAAKVLICRPRDPEAKGLVERLHDYLERSFLPGRVFGSPDDFNAQLQQFLGRANTRQHRAAARRTGSTRTGPGCF